MAYTTKTLGDLQHLLAMKWEDTPFWTPEEARLAVNDALAWWGLLTGSWPQRATLNAAIGEHEYALPGTLLWRTRVIFQGTVLEISSRADLDRGQPTWMGETAGDVGVPAAPLVWAPISLQSIAIWPAPAATVINGLVVDGLGDAPILSEDADTVDLEEGWISHLLGMALCTAAWKEGGPRFASTLPLFQAFIGAAVEQNGQLTSSQVFRSLLGLDTRRGEVATRGADTSTFQQTIGQVLGG